MSNIEYSSKDTYTIKATYYDLFTDKDGQLTEIERKNQDVVMLKLHRRNSVHSQLAVDMIRDTNGDNIVELAVRFIRCCVADEKLAERIAGDQLSCVSIYTHPEVQKDKDRFFGGWDFLQRIEESPSLNE